MTFGFEVQFRRLTQRYSDPLLTLLTALLLMMMFVGAPLQAGGFVIFQAFGVAVGLAMIVSALVMSGSLTVFLVMLTALGINVAVIALRLLDRPSAYDLYLVTVAWLMITITLGWAVARAVFGPGRVSYHRIMGAVLLYLLIGMTFVALFVLVGLFVPRHFPASQWRTAPHSRPI